MGAAPFLIPEGALGVVALLNVLIALLDILMLCAILGMLWGYKHTFGALVKFIVDHTTIHTPFGSFSPFFPLELANNAVMAQMSVAALALEKSGGLFFHSLGVIIGWMVNLTAYSATTMEHAFHWLVHVYIPGRASWAASVLFPPALLAKLIRAAVEKAMPHERKAVRAQVQPVAKSAHAAKTQATTADHTAAKAGKVAHAAAVAQPLAPAFPIPHIDAGKAWRGLTKKLARIERRLAKAEKWTAAGALAIAMANVLGVSARCLRSGNVGKTARKLCGLSPRALEDLLGLIADVLILQNICTVITLMEDGFKLIEPELTAFIVTAEKQFVHCKYDLPTIPAISLPYLPPVTGVVLNTP